MRSKLSWLQKTRKRTRPTQLLPNVRRITSRISKSQIRQAMCSRAKVRNNNSKCRQCHYHQVWCLCPRMQQECSSSHNHSWVSRSSHKAFLVNSACQCHQARWVKDRCLWCLECRVCLCHQCSSLWVEWCQIRSLTKQCLSCQVNSHQLALIQIHISNPNKCHLLNPNRRRKSLLRKVGEMSWPVQRKKGKRLFRNRRKRWGKSNSNNGRMRKKRGMAMKCPGCLECREWIWTTFKRQALTQML